LCDFEPGTLKALIAAARQRKKARNGLSRGAEDKDAPLSGKMLALIFEKPSTRTRISFDVGMQELGGRCIMLTDKRCSSAGARPSPIPRACCRAMSMRS
jgi:ornithine carbamoyltransferase